MYIGILSQKRYAVYMVKLCEYIPYLRTLIANILRLTFYLYIWLYKSYCDSLKCVYILYFLQDKDSINIYYIYTNSDVHVHVYAEIYCFPINNVFPSFLNVLV